LVLEDFVLHKAEQPVGLQPWAPANNGSIPHPTSPWADPLTGEPLIMTASSAHNPVTGVCYPVEEGLPRLFVPTTVSTANGQDVLDTVKQFYEKTPFPNYDHLDDRRVFFEKAGARLFARLLNEQIPYGARVLEVGCGTGQLTNFLAMAHRSVL